MPNSIPQPSVENDQVLYRQTEGVGWITLNRPKALNALSLGMVKSISAYVKSYANDNSVHTIVIQGNGRGFCAGGDLRAGYTAWHSGDNSYAEVFFRYEYELNRLIHHLQKPYVSLLHGVTMGGGMGISIHGSHRLVTEEAVLAMPETSIGFFPDVGSTYFLNRCPGELGMYLALTGNHISGTDALYAGLATHFLPKHQLPSFVADLEKGVLLEQALAQYTQGLEQVSPLQLNQEIIDRCFGQNTLEEVFTALQNESTNFAAATLATLEKRCPGSLRTTFAHMRETKHWDIDRIIDRDYELSQKLAIKPDFAEGIRAAVIDKDRNPQWQS